MSELAPALRARGFAAQLTAEAGMLNVDDAVQLSYPTTDHMTILTYNARDFLILAREYAEAGLAHSGIISSEQFSRRRFGELLRLTLHLMSTLTAAEMHNQVIYLQRFNK